MVRSERIHFLPDRSHRLLKQTDLRDLKSSARGSNPLMMFRLPLQAFTVIAFPRRPSEEVPASHPLASHRNARW